MANEIDLTAYAAKSKEELMVVIGGLLQKQAELMQQKNEDPSVKRKMRQYLSNHDNPEKVKLLTKVTAEELKTYKCPRDIETDGYPKTALIDLDNWAIFDSEVVKPEEIDSAMFLLRSMLHQIALFAGNTMPKDKRTILVSLFQMLDTWEDGAVKYYFDMVDKLAGNTNKDNRNKNRQKPGNYGIDKRMFN